MPDIEDGDTNVGVRRWVNSFVKVNISILGKYFIFDILVTDLYIFTCMHAWTIGLGV